MQFVHDPILACEKNNFPKCASHVISRPLFQTAFAPEQVYNISMGIFYASGTSYREVYPILVYMSRCLYQFREQFYARIVHHL
jgi:hypothetical protein